MTPPVPVLQQEFCDYPKCSVVFGDVMSRLGTLEEQVREILPAISRVAEGMDTVVTSVTEVRGKVEGLTQSFYDYKIDKVEIDARLKALEETNEDKKKQELEQKKEAKERRGRIINITGGAVASLIVAALIYFLKLK